MYKEEPPWVSGVKKTKEKDPWDAYLEEFVKKHELPEVAVKRAKKYLERAKKARDANRARVKRAEREGHKDKAQAYKDREQQIFKELLVMSLESAKAQLNRAGKILICSDSPPSGVSPLANSDTRL